MRRLFKLLLNKVSLGILIGIGLAIGCFTAAEYTSTDNFCAACHIHPHATQTWKRSTHYDNQSGIQVH
ncbi:MAG: NapC/NirT family cytochrome c, partial [Planctomycetota bacterium]